jgi:MoxR-like ATPase
MNFTGARFDPTKPPVLELGPDENAYVYHDPRIVFAVNVALSTRRPLLVTGSPGSGKSTLAADVSRRLGWALVRETITSRTRLEDLVAGFDAVRRLNDAQARRLNENESAYRVPGVLWWAFDPDTAESAAGEITDRRHHPDHAQRGIVVLLDEIDKAEPDLPNDLLGPLDLYRIDVPGFGAITAPNNCLMVITSNGERTMPPAFLRRCVALELADDDPEFFTAVATSHFGQRADSLYLDLAKRTLQLVADANRDLRRPPSMAEYLDTLQACLDFNERPPSDEAPNGSPLWACIEEAALRKTRPQVRDTDNVDTLP